MTSVQNEHSDAPPLTYRWLHGGPELDDLTAVPLASTSNATAPSVFRSFTDEENKRLEEAWLRLEPDDRERAWRTKSVKIGSTSGKSSPASSRRGSAAQTAKPDKSKLGVKSGKSDNAPPPADSAVDDTDEADNDEDAYGEGYIADRVHEEQPHIVHVSQDNLFSADVRNWSLYPVFWKGARIGILRATWFYSSTNLSKFYPVDPLLAYHLEEAYAEIKPYDSSYADELRSALEFGPEAEVKLKHSMPEVGVDVIFQGKSSARLYARNLPARLSKSFLTSFIRDKGHSSGGTLVYRGYDTVLKHSLSQPTSASGKSPSKPKAEADKLASKAVDIKQQASVKLHKDHLQPDGSETPDKSQTASETPKTGALGSLFSFKNRFTGSSKSGVDAAEHGDSNTTSEAMDDDKGTEDGSEPELAELVLVVHGIGQKLAVTYDSFNIVHAINQLRKLCNKKGRDPAVSQLTGNKRIQFIPLQWRSSLQFDEMEEKEESDSAFDNTFTLDDVQVQGSIPFVRTLVSGVGMDLAFYLSHHRDKMTSTVVRDANRIYRLFCKRNPNFKGKVSIIAHSLGTALATDVLSNQPTFVPENPSPKDFDKHFVFDVSSLFFLGSPVAYMFFLNRGQLIPRYGRERTKDAPPDVALDKAGRYGCMAIDSLYNVYNMVDPVACCLNACVDSEYAKIVKPQPVNTITSTLLSDYTAKVSSFFGSIMSTFGSSSSSAAASNKGTSEEEEEEESQSILQKGLTGKDPHKPTRPRTKRQATTEMDISELKRFNRAEARMLGLNPQGTVDFYLTQEGFSEYYAMLLSHASYWSDARFATFVLTQLLAGPEALRKGREKLEEEAEREAAKQAEEESKSSK
ncbi:hypothetical protein P389DRAFT_164561 [Cystobasidium minutum MCA 4210]|uniref:uncharacterized protein n=1 Tax=Cystobasidium minutum MCA 4210 TaxID=1397322 RepID=UPI0034CF8AD7|eukprot:jgi/Rhomi1/164561/fgenesh1_kg.1_\